MSGKGTIAITGDGATVTVCINRAFAERLIDFINAMPDNRKAEGDNQVLAGFLETALTRAVEKEAKKGVMPGERKMPRWQLRQRLRKSRDAIKFWKRLLENLVADDGSAVAVVNDKIAKHEAQVVEFVVALEELGPVTGAP